MDDEELKETEAPEETEEGGGETLLDGITAEDLAPDTEDGEGGGAQGVDEKIAAAIEENNRKWAATVEALAVDKKNLQKALHEERHSRKAQKAPDEAVLTDADLVQIINEHKDDPAVLLNAVKYQTQQALKAARGEFMNETEMKQKAQKMRTILRARFGESLDDDGSQVRQGINKAKEFLGMSDHPYGDAIGAAAIVFDQLELIKQIAYEKGRTDALNDKVEDRRRARIDSAGIIPRDKSPAQARDKASALSESEMETARRLGFDKDPRKLAIYKNQMLGKK